MRLHEGELKVVGERTSTPQAEARAPGGNRRAPLFDFLFEDELPE